MDVPARQGIFVGYPTDGVGYLVYFPDTRSTVVTRSVLFHERWRPLSPSAVFSSQGEAEDLTTVFPESLFSSPAQPSDISSEHDLPQAVDSDSSSSDEEPDSTPPVPQTPIVTPIVPHESANSTPAVPFELSDVSPAATPDPADVFTPVPHDNPVFSP